MIRCTGKGEEEESSAVPLFCGDAHCVLCGTIIEMKRVISIVEDERDLNELVKRYLEKEGYEARSYLTYDEASLHTGDDDVHLWILDIMLGDKSGFDLIEDIRRRNPNVPVIFMSARDKEFDRIIGLEKGSDDYITKPFSPKELVLRVNNIMRRTYRSGDEKITVDGYTIDEGKRVAYDTEGNDIDLSTKEYELLMLFVKNRGTAFSRDQILRQVWETNYYGSDRVVDDTMRRLRKKMPDLNIHTIYGFGYRLG